MQLQFAKMHGLGNDFMVLRWPDGLAGPDASLVREWSDRRRGVGFDQLLIIEPRSPEGMDAAYRVFNADGGEVEQCGNGVRCIARFLRPNDDEGRLRLMSRAGPVEAVLLPGGDVTVALGEPDFCPKSLPFEVDAMQERYRVTLDDGRVVELGAVSLGNPHVVIAVDSVDDAPVGILGPALTVHPCFPKGVNVGFMQVENGRRIRLRVYERGAGETTACGTGAAAAVAVGRRWGRLAEEVDVSLPGGTLRVRWPGRAAALWLAGPATWVYEGKIRL